MPIDAIKAHRPHAQRPRQRFGETVESVMMDLVELAEVARQRLREEGDGKGAASLIRELRSIDATLLGLMSQHAGCVSPEAMDEIRRAISGALQPFPEARRAVDDVLYELEGRWNQR